MNKKSKLKKLRILRSEFFFYLLPFNLNLSNLKDGFVQSLSKEKK
jgi:hypothetical protein